MNVGHRGILLSIEETSLIAHKDSMVHWCLMTHRNRGILLSIGETVDFTQRQHGSLVSHDSQAQGHAAEYWRDRCSFVSYDSQAQGHTAEYWRDRCSLVSHDS